MESQRIYTGRKLSLHIDKIELESGERFTVEVVEHPGSVVVVPILRGQLVLVRQYRYPVGEWILEFPAGTLKPCEDPASCAIRELEEETGLIAKRLDYLGTMYIAPGYSSEKMHVFIASELREGKSHREVYELIEVVLVEPSRLKDMIAEGQVTDAKTIAAFYLVNLRGYV